MENNISTEFEDAYYVDMFESRLGILNNDLKLKLQKEYESNKAVYELLHHRNHVLLRCQLFRLAKECKQKTPENYETLVREILYDNLNISFSKLGVQINDMPKNLYPVYPSYHHDQIIEIAKSIQPYYTDKTDFSYLNLCLKVDFYANWHNLLSLSEKESETYWINKALNLVAIEPDKDKRLTISNVIRRKYPNIDKYLSSRGA